MLGWILVRVRQPRTESDTPSKTKRHGLWAPALFILLGTGLICLGVHARETGAIGNSKGAPVFWWQNVLTGILMIVAAIYSIVSTRKTNKRRAYKAPLPTPANVTPAVDAPVAPLSGAASRQAGER
jgi:tellurite resistance protein TehA-like permease